jgi:hypothetical protein
MSREAKKQSFERLNSVFEEKLRDPALYTGKRFSFLKIFQHALTYDESGAHSRMLKNYMHWPLWAHNALLNLKALRSGNQQNEVLREIVFIDPARILRDDSNEWHSIYMERAEGIFPPELVSKLNRKKEPRLRSDLSLDEISRFFPSPDAIEREMLREVYAIARNTRHSSHWTQSPKKHILSALHLFFDDFRFYYGLFRRQPVQSVVFISHYHNEGLIAALNVLNIRSIELQHGLISGNDLYYQYAAVFKEGVKNAFFPDRICVYGSHWKRILLKGCEFSDTQITIAGDYQWQPEAQPNDASPQNRVLICSQKNMHDDYVSYARRLAPIMGKHPDWRWTIKLHPLEKNKKAYEVLKDVGFEIVDQERTLFTLLRESRIQISIYSTTFYDALGLDIRNMSLQNYGNYKDYAAQMIIEGVASPLGAEQDPIEVFLSLKEKSQLLQREDVYAAFDAEALREAILPNEPYSKRGFTTLL